MLFDLCIKNTLWSKGKNGVVTSHKILWKKVVEDWATNTNLAWDKSRLKNKLDGLRPKWILWKQLKGKETGLGWDHEKGTVAASNEWWALKIQQNPKFETFRDEGIDLELECKMDQVFGGCAQGAEKFTPVADHPNLTIDHETYVPSPPTNFPIGDSTCMFNDMDEVGSTVGNEWDAMWREASPTSSNLQDTLNDISDKGRGKRVMESGSSQSNKSAKTESTKKTRGSVALCEKIDGMVQLVSERNNSTKEFQVAMANMMNSMNISAPKYSVTDAMLKLCSMGDLDSNSPEFYYACTLIEDPQRRTILLEFPDDKKRVDYIRFMYAQHMGGK
ncbi:L10-interacting MYB domain-containing protein [Bienertia sinuspersici]